MAVLLFLGSLLNLVRATFTITSTGQQVITYDLPLFGLGRHELVDSYTARLVQVSVDDRCELTMQGQFVYQLKVDETDPEDDDATASDSQPRVYGDKDDDGDTLIAMVNLSDRCPTVATAMLANKDPASAEAREIVKLVDMFMFISRYNSTEDIGGLSEPTFGYYRDALPFDIQSFVAVGADGAQVIRQALAQSDVVTGLTISAVHKHSPWDPYYRSATYLGIRWGFFTINLLVAIYVAYHTFRLVYPSGLIMEARYLFRLGSSVLLLLNFILIMISPLEETFTRASACIRTVGIVFGCFACLLLLMQWSQVLYAIYNWRYIRTFYIFLLCLDIGIALFLALLLVQVYQPGTPGLSGLLQAIVLYVIPACMLLILVVLILTSVWVSRAQKDMHSTGVGPTALLRLTHLCILSSVGWILIIIFMILGASYLERPRISYFIAYTVCTHVSSILAAAAILWTLAVSSNVRPHTTSLHTSAPRRRTLIRSTHTTHTLTCPPSACDDPAQSSNHPLVYLASHTRASLSEKDRCHLSYPLGYSEEKSDVLVSASTQSWHDRADDAEFPSAEFGGRNIL
ncbi:hypothetical protein IWQ60_005690 [Tieghemiomyces parasiticus]|uniref:Uncharacterized protein n=1 Tax=Tieghemiomyces parasiticus TaxID=78921 RepID=A0A9W8A5T1_9FUNG|nr:hypothetical protein IWQ60_005690 [Tieghemiomyces parasiticus]